MAIPDTMTDSGEQAFPDDWISIAAYFLWKGEGEPEGRESEYWERAKAELTQLRKDGKLQIPKQTLDEEG